MNRRKPDYTVLGIDTSCDDTSAGIVSGNKVLANIISSQISLHKEFGGVVPSVAKRAHQEKIDYVISRALKSARVSWDDIDAIGVTIGPGLAIALEVGIAKAKELAQKHKKPLVAVNHMEGHLLASFAENINGKGPLNGVSVTYPVLGFLVSGGHTELVLMREFGDYELLGETLDDAAGEAYDKVAKMLKLGYPGGPIVDELAQKGNSERFKLPLPLAHEGSLNFSFSGLKTACLYALRDIEARSEKDYLEDFCATFQKMVIAHLSDRLAKALKRYPVKQVLLGGGVVQNIPIRKALKRVGKKYGAEVYVPYAKNLCADNGAIIALSTGHAAMRGEFVKDVSSLDRNPILNFT